MLPAPTPNYASQFSALQLGHYVHRFVVPYVHRSALRLSYGPKLPALGGDCFGRPLTASK